MNVKMSADQLTEENGYYPLLIDARDQDHLEGVEAQLCHRREFLVLFCVFFFTPYDIITIINCRSFSPSESPNHVDTSRRSLSPVKKEGKIFYSCYFSMFLSFQLTLIFLQT